MIRLSHGVRRLVAGGVLTLAACGAPGRVPALAGPAATLMVDPRAVSNGALVVATMPATGTSQYAVTPDQASNALFKRLANHGAGLIRLVTNPRPLLADDVAARAAAVAQVLAVVDAMRAAGLRVIVDLHNWPPGNPAQQSAELINDAGQRARLSRALVALARQLKSRPMGSVGLELLNEPACKFMTAMQWPEAQAQFYRALRREAPVLPLVLKGCNDGNTDLMRLDVGTYRKDPNAIFSFHFYEPFIFTHQATYYRGSAFRGVPFPPVPGKVGRLPEYFGMPSEQIKPESVTELAAYLRGGRGVDVYAGEISQVGAWADREGIARRRILLGEFGTTLKPGLDVQKIRPDMLRWLQMVSQTSQREGFAYSLWPPVRPFGLYIDPVTNLLSSDVLRAVGWREAKGIRNGER